MALTIGIVSLPDAGKSTLFNALTHNDVLAANYPFTTIEPNVGMVEVPDSRLPMLAKTFDSQRIVPATVSFVDIAGIVRGISKGEGTGSTFLANIREADTICQVIRVFGDVGVTRVDGKMDPAGNINTVTTELILMDLQSLEKVLSRMEKEARIKKESCPGLEAIQTAVEVLGSGKRAHSSRLDMELLRGLLLFTVKPFLYVFNCNQDELADEDLKNRMHQVVAPAEAILLDAKLEAELVEMGEEGGRVLSEEVGITGPGPNVLARVGYEILGPQSYLTKDPKEARAWTIPQRTTTPEAAGVIHTNSQKDFIEAQIVDFDDLVAAGSKAAAKAAGKMRLEGKNYVMWDGDVVEFGTGLTSKR